MRENGLDLPLFFRKRRITPNEKRPAQGVYFLRRPFASFVLVAAMCACEDVTLETDAFYL